LAQSQTASGQTHSTSKPAQTSSTKPAFFNREKFMSKMVELRVGNNPVIIGDDRYDSWDTQSLRRRVRQLEYAVKVLYFKVGLLGDDYINFPPIGGLESKPEPTPSTKVNCTIETGFEVYSVIADSEPEARHQAMEKCKAGESFDSKCAPTNVKCVK
jgi:hypothetical protein